MSELMAIHNKAMDKSLLADKALSSGDAEQAKELYKEALELECKAAFMAEQAGTPEPGLSILFRSAASLAYQCGKLRECERLVAHALAGNPPADVALDLREMLQQVYSSDDLMETQSEISVNIRIPKSETSLFSTIIKRMGWAASNFKNKVAVL